MGRVDDAVAPGLIHHRAHALVIKGILLAADDTDILSVGAAGQSAAATGRGAPDGVYDGLQARRGETLGGRAPVQPNGPGSRVGLVEGVEKHGGVVGITGGHAGPEDQAVFVWHGILLGSRGCGAVAGPLQVNVAVDIVGVAISHEGIYEALVGRLVGGTPVRGAGLRVAVPPILVQGNADAIDVPILHRFL